MTIIDSIKAYLASHKSLMQEIEAMTIQDALNLIQALYPDDKVLIDILAKIAADVEKLQGIQQT